MTKRKSLNMTNYIYEYYQKIEDGTLVAGKWMKLLYERIIDGIERKQWFYNPKKAALAILFIENFCRHYQGGKTWKSGQTVELELWQKAFISVLFGIVNEDGSRQFQECILVVGRKNGKTLLASAISAYCAFADGEAGGRIYMLAPKLEQAKFCFHGLVQMVKAEPELANISKKRRTDVYIPETDTIIQPWAFSEKKSDGMNPSLVICDEIASWPRYVGNLQYDVLKSSIGARRQPLILCITTAGYEEDGPYDSLIKRGTQWLLGNSTEMKLLPVIYQIDDITKWNNVNELAKANPNLGVSLSVDYLLEQIRIAESNPSHKTELLTKFANIHQNSSQAFLSSRMIEGAFQSKHDISDFAHHYCTIGIDLSQTTDLTACSVVIEKNGILNVFTKFWIPAGRLKDAEERDGVPYGLYVQQGYVGLSGDMMIDYHDCENYILGLIKQYEILPLVVGFDRYCAAYLVQDLKQEGLNMDDVRQYYNLEPVIAEFEGLMSDKNINIADGNPLMKMHLADMAMKTNSAGQRMPQKIRRGSSTHIDGAAALLDSLCARQKWYGQYGELLKN